MKIRNITTAALALVMLLGAVGCGTDPVVTPTETVATTAVTTKPDSIRETEETETEAYEVVFDPAMDGLEPVVVDVENGNPVCPPVFEASGYRFAGWDTDLEDIDGDTTVTAKWDRLSMNSVEIAEYADKRVGTVNVVLSGGNKATGTGFFIDGNGTIVTNYHVIEMATEITFTIGGGTYEVAEIINFSSYYDLATLRVDIDDNDYFQISKDVRKGENVYTYGSALGLEGTIGSGVISSTSRRVGVADCIQMTASISHGNSGGPLINEQGQVIGINAYSYVSGNDMYFAIKAEQLEEMGEDKNMSISEYIEWWNTEIERSYCPPLGSDLSQKTLSIINNYQTVTGRRCLGSCDDWYGYIVGSPESPVIDGYISGYMCYRYSYNTDEFDEYKEYLKGMGFVYQPDESASDGDILMSTYYNELFNIDITLIRCDRYIYVYNVFCQ